MKTEVQGMAVFIYMSEVWGVHSTCAQFKILVTLKLNIR